MLAHYINADPTNQRTAVGLYGITMIAMGVCFTVLWAHLYRRTDIRADGVDTIAIRAPLIRACGGTIAYVVGTTFIFLAPMLALAMFAALVVVFIFARPASLSATPRPN